MKVIVQKFFVGELLRIKQTKINLFTNFYS